MSYTSTDPATGEVVATFAEHTPAEVEERLAGAAAAFVSWRGRPFAERARCLAGAAGLFEAQSQELASLLTAEMGKTLAAARAEVAKCALALRWSAANAERILAPESVASAAAESRVECEPLGPVLAVMPWNFPLWQVVRFAAPALMAGNCCLVKHASNVPRAAIALEDLFRRSGLPAGVYTNLLLSAGRVAAIVADDRVAAVTLTGSEAAGRAVAAAAGAALKKCVLELGGSDPFLVLDSADLGRAVPAAVAARVQNNGQSCIAAKRFVVVASRYEAFLEGFVAAMAALRVGDPRDPSTDVGPLVSAAQREEVAGQVEDARARGATVHCGGAVPGGRGYYYPPTVLTGVTPGMRAGREEVFGPVAVVHRVGGLEEALRVANGTPWGLGASVWAEDPAEQRAATARLEAGMVFVNAVVASTPELPFGGTKRSGYGRELAAAGLREFCSLKTVFVARDAG
jgi:succinate-semialdehyde dehydrogenase/glutarate-semialdehyde dehydrogenase